MLAAFLVALREGVEAALVVGIILVYLHRTGRARLARFVWAGVALAVASSLAVALALERWQVNQEGFEGLLMLLAALFVVTMVVWMNRVARRLRRQIEQRVERYAQRATLGAGLGLGVFALLMVLREGVEMALILRAVEVSSQGLGTWAGTGLGLALAVAVGLFFFKGTLRIPLARFFAATSVILMVVAFQLALSGVHELSEAMWIPSSQREMAVIGPMVRNAVFFFVVILGVAALLVLREWLALPRRDAPGEEADPAERLRWESDQRRQRRWMFAAAFTCVAAALALTADFLYARPTATPWARPLTPQGDAVRIPVAELDDSGVNFFSVRAGGVPVRFLVYRKPGGAYAAALDACLICGPFPYWQDGSNVICSNCDAIIATSLIGDVGGCNPVPVPSRLEAGELVIPLSALAKVPSPPAE